MTVGEALRQTGTVRVITPGKEVIRAYATWMIGIACAEVENWVRIDGHGCGKLSAVARRRPLTDRQARRIRDKSCRAWFYD